MKKLLYMLMLTVAFTVHAADKAVFVVQGLYQPQIAPLKAAIAQAAKENKELVLKIDSGGGEIFTALELGQIIEAYPKDVTCIVDNTAYSAAFMVLQSCDNRLMTKRSSLMVHAPSVSNFTGTYEELLNEAAKLKVLTSVYTEASISKLHITREEFLEQIHNKDWYMDWETAMEVGAVDDVIQPSEIPALTQLITPQLDSQSLLRLLQSQ